jgi:hypothetical protein
MIFQNYLCFYELNYIYSSTIKLYLLTKTSHVLLQLFFNYYVSTFLMLEVLKNNIS